MTLDNLLSLALIIAGTALFLAVVASAIAWISWLSIRRIVIFNKHPSWTFDEALNRIARPSRVYTISAIGLLATVVIGLQVLLLGLADNEIRFSQIASFMICAIVSNILYNVLIVSRIRRPKP